MQKLENIALTNKYTTVFHEEDFKFNAPHLFQVVKTIPGDIMEKVGEVHFQEGPIKECGVNGVCNEDLLAMVIKRLECFQESEYACEENAEAIKHLYLTLGALRARTTKREERGVEGTHAL